MSLEQIIRAWKDEDYRLSLSEDERAQLPEHPAGLIELSDEELGAVSGGAFFPSVDCSLFVCGTSDQGHIRCY